VSAPIKTCACGRSYTAEQWRRLRLVGIQPDEPVDLELRDCECGSTLAMPVETRRAA